MTDDLTPSFLRDDGGDAVEGLKPFLGFLKKTAGNHVERCLKKPQNELMKRLWPHVLDAEQQTYLCIADRKKVSGRSHRGIERHLGQGLGLADLGERGMAFFTNAMKVPDAVSLPQGDEFYPPPSRRIANCGLYVHTVEFDPQGTPDEVKAALGKQIGWCFGGKKPEETTLGRLHKQLCSYPDYRGVEAVWSGNKSLHLHFLFDIRHLAPTKFDQRDHKLVSAETLDVPDELLRSGLQDFWDRLARQVETFLGFGLSADPALRQPENFRRLPWGIRQAEANNVLGFPEGTPIPQAVLFSMLRHHAKDPEEHRCLHRVSDFFTVAAKKPQTRFRRSIGAATNDLTADEQRDFLEVLTDLCYRAWGSPVDHPRPASLHSGANGFEIGFYNNQHDTTPSSVMSGDHNRLLIYSADPDVRGRTYVLPLSANELVEVFLRTGDLGGDLIQRRSRNLIEQRVLGPDDPDAWKPSRRSPDTPEALRNAIAQAIPVVALGNAVSAILTPEGAGKTTSLLQAMVTHHEPEEGFMMFAARSYEQAEEKCDQFNELFPDSGFVGVVLGSFSSTYSSLVPEDHRATSQDAAEAGASSLLQYVYDSDPSTVALLEQHKKEFWDALRLPPKTIKGKARDLKKVPIFFTVHSVAQKWHLSGGTRFWLNPHYQDFQNATGERREMLRQQIEAATRLQWLIHDEVSADDLLFRASEAEVAWCHSVEQRLDGSWRQASPQQRLAAYRDQQTGLSVEISFERCSNILDAGFTPEEAYVADASTEPFGRGTQNAYAKVTGQKAFVKSRDWLTSHKRVTLLTTEHRIFAILESLAARRTANHPVGEQPDMAEMVSEDGAMPVPAGRTTAPIRLFNFDLPEVFPSEAVEVGLKLDPRASKEKLADLLDDLRQTHSGCQFISDLAKGTDVATHEKAKGSNSFRGSGVPTISVYTYLAIPQYADLLIENAFTGRSDMTKLWYLDRFNQTCGRTLGYRHSPDTPTYVVMSPNLWREIGVMLMMKSRYRPF